MDDRAFIRSFEGIHNKRFLTLAALGLLAFVVVLSGLVAGFREDRVSKSADAMALVQSQPRTPVAPPAVPVK
jgi:hypothetical protein